MTHHVLLDLNKWETYIHIEHIYIIKYIYIYAYEECMFIEYKPINLKWAWDQGPSTAGKESSLKKECQHSCCHSLVYKWMFMT